LVVCSAVYEVSSTFTEIGILLKMRKPVFFTLSLLFLYSSLTAQSDKKKGGWAGTLTAALIPISQPGLGIQPGVEYRFNNRLSLLAEICIPVNGKNSKDSSELNKKYMRVKSEIRYCLLGKSKKSHLYTGFQVSSSRRRFINQNGFIYDKQGADSVTYYNKASINSPVTTVSLQLGSIITKGKFAFDVFAGIGARFIHTTISDVEIPARGVILRPDGLRLTASYSYAGNATMFHFNGGVRLMWHFYEFRHSQK
jgi:hypothetical protein